MITVFLRFADAEAAAAIVRAALFESDRTVEWTPSEATSMGYTASGIRFDLVPVGGDGILRVVIGTDDVDREGGCVVAQPRLEVRPGHHLNLLWHGTEEDLPDFGAARIHPTSPSQVFAA